MISVSSSSRPTTQITVEPTTSMVGTTSITRRAVTIEIARSKTLGSTLGSITVFEATKAEGSIDSYPTAN